MLVLFTVGCGDQTVNDGPTLGGTMSDADEILIRTAKTSDAEDLCSVLIASITDLCHADHHRDPEKIAEWIANKTPRNVRHWIADDGLQMLVAIKADRIAGVAGYTMDGEITLNYVAPQFRFQGISEAILSRIERDFVGLGIAQGHLESTLTARDFYLSRGWTAAGAVQVAFGMPGQPMVKDLTAPTDAITKD